MPQSLDLIELRKTYESVYRNRRFSFWEKYKEYSKYVVSVTFKYSVKEFNRLKADTYVKFGYATSDVNLEDSVCIKNGELIAIQVNTKVASPISQELLGKYFFYKDGTYHIKSNVKTLYSIADLRRAVYEDGFFMDGVHYVRWKRSAGSARVGKCLFIAEPLYQGMHRWELCGLKIKEGDQIDLAGFESYIALTLSSIIGLVEIQPENILLIDDYESVFKDKVVNVVEVDGALEAHEEEVEVRNAINDGMSLIDPPLMEKYSPFGFILLRNRFFKSAAFNFNIQLFFKEHGITEVSQLNGRTRAHRIEDVKLITTPSSIKYLKFGSFDEWLDNVGELFGVVKHEKKTHFFDGRMVKVHYQLLNCLQMNNDEVAAFVKPTLDYIELLKSNPAAMRYHIKFVAAGDDEGEDTDERIYTHFSAKSKNDIVFKMLGINDRFTNTKLYADFKHDVIDSFVRDAKCGHILVDGNYSVLCGNPIEMALIACGQFDGQSVIGVGNVYSTRFAFGQALLGSRSPHVAQGNNWLMWNKYNADVERYCNLTDEIIVVNSIGENLLSRLSGSDFDSDTALITNNPHLISACRKNYERFLVPTGSVHSVKLQRKFTNADKCDLDIKTCQNLIGEIVNLSQELNTKFWDGLNGGSSFEDVKQFYLDSALLDVLSNIEIDRAKREFTVDSKFEIKRIREKYNEYDKNGRAVKPKFFGHVAKKKGYYDPKKKKYKAHQTTMDILQTCFAECRHIKPVGKYAPFSDIVASAAANCKIDYDEAQRVLDHVRETKTSIRSVWAIQDVFMDREEKYNLASTLQQECINYIDEIRLTKGTMYYLLQMIEQPECANMYRTMFYSLFGAPNKSFYELIVASKEPIGMLVENDIEGDIAVFGMRFSQIDA